VQWWYRVYREDEGEPGCVGCGDLRLRGPDFPVAMIWGRNSFGSHHNPLQRLKVRHTPADSPPEK
jgi:hypothetical protein